MDRVDLDTQLMAVAQRMEQDGYTDDAEQMRSALAYLRESWRGAHDDDAEEAVITIRDAADSLLAVIHRDLTRAEQDEH